MGAKIYGVGEQADDRRVAECLHAILLLDSGQNADALSSIFHIHPKTLKRSRKAFATKPVSDHYISGME